MTDNSERLPIEMSLLREECSVWFCNTQIQALLLLHVLVMKFIIVTNCEVGVKPFVCIPSAGLKILSTSYFFEILLELF